MERTENERAQLVAIRERAERLRAFLVDHPAPNVEDNLREW
ncbi:MAG: hypothetical protein AVDCRST_MAG59-916, partial [uncultured Thermomicrobiales bacterium]